MTEKQAKPAIRFAGYTDAWEQRKLGEIVNFSGGHTPSMSISENYVEQGHMWLTSQDIKSTYLVVSTSTLSDKGIAELRQYDPGTLVMVVRSGILRHTLPISMIMAPSAVNQDIKAMEIKGCNSSLWLLYSLKSAERFLLRNYSKTGTTVESMDSDKLKDLPLHVPTAAEQKMIGCFFEHLDQIITLHQRKYDKLVCIKKAMLEKMFPKNGVTVPEIRFAGFSGAWEQRKAKDLFVSTADKGHPELPVLSATQDRGMIKRDDNGISIFHDKKNEEGYKRVVPGQFVIHLRSFQGGFAHSAIEGITSPAYTVFGFQEPEKHDENYWKYVFSSKEFIRRLETVTYGIRDGRSISYDEFLTMSFLYPQKDEQTKIASFLDETTNLLTLHQRELEKLKNLKKAMLEKMFV